MATMPASNRKLRALLCHASQDKPIVRELYQRLNTEGWIDPWIDKEKLLPGQDWELEIEKSVEVADVVIICLSKVSVGKEGYYQKEIKKILDVAEEKPEGTIFIIPLRLDDCIIPRRLAKWQYEDYFLKENRDKSFARLLQSLGMRAKSLKINVKDAKSTSELLNLGIEFDRILKAHYSDSPQKPEFRFFLLNKDVKVKDYMHPDTFDGYKVPLKYRVLNRDGSDKETGILHFQVIRPVK